MKSFTQYIKEKTNVRAMDNSKYKIVDRLTPDSRDVGKYGKPVAAFQGENVGANGVLYELDSFDKNYYSHIRLREGEFLMRYSNQRTLVSDMTILVKVSLKKMMFYLLDEDKNDDGDDKNPKFESRGIIMQYLTVQSGTQLAKSLQRVRDDWVTDRK